MRQYPVALLASVVALLATPASADLVFKSDNAHVRLGNKPCTGKVASLLLNEWLPKFKDGYAVVGGKAVRLCWIEHPAGMVTIIDEDGDGGQLPLSAFKESGA